MFHCMMNARTRYFHIKEFLIIVFVRTKFPLSKSDYISYGKDSATKIYTDGKLVSTPEV